LRSQGIIVKTQSGEYGIVYNDEKPVESDGVMKQRVHLLRDQKGTISEIAASPVTLKTMLCKRESLEAKGFII